MPKPVNFSRRHCGLRSVPRALWIFHCVGYYTVVSFLFFVFYCSFSFLAHLAQSARGTIRMGLGPASGRLSVRPSVNNFKRLLLINCQSEFHETSSKASVGRGMQTIQNGILITSSVWLPWQPWWKSLTIFSSETNGWIWMKFGRHAALTSVYKRYRTEFWLTPKNGFQGAELVFPYMSILKLMTSINIFSFETIGWIFTIFYQNDPCISLMQILNFYSVPWRTLVAMATKRKILKPTFL